MTSATDPLPRDGGTGDPLAGAALSAMYERRARSLYGLCLMLLRDPHEAEDALQTTFTSAYRALLAGTRPRHEAAWLATIARNECRGRIRDRMRQPVNAGDDELATLPSPSPPPDELVKDESVGRALAALPERQREAIVLHDVYGLRAREVGTALALTVPAVEAALFRGRRQLRGRLRALQPVLAVPPGVQQLLEGSIPGFAAGTATVGPAIVGTGILAKVVGLPTVVKAATGVAAAVTAGSVVAVQVADEPVGRVPTRTAPNATAVTAPPDSRSGGGAVPATLESGAGEDDRSGRQDRGRDEGAGEDRSGHEDDDSSGHSGSGSGGLDDDATTETESPTGQGSRATVVERPTATDDGDRSGPSTTTTDDADSSGQSGGSESGSGSGASGSSSSGPSAEPETDASASADEGESSSGSSGGSGSHSGSGGSDEQPDDDGG